MSNDLQQIIGTAAGDILGDGQIVKSTALVDLVNKVQMYYGNAELSCTSPFDASIKIPKGNVTIEDIYSVYVYDNYLSTITISGAQLRKYLELSVCRFYKTYSPGDTAINRNDNVPYYYLDILQGASYSVDLTQSGLFDGNGNPLPDGLPRITQLIYNGADVLDDQVFTLALNSYRINGGGGFLSAAGIRPQRSNPTTLNYITFDSKKTYGEAGQVKNLIILYFQEMTEGKIYPGQTAVEPICENNWLTIPRFYSFMSVSDLHGAIDNSPATGIPQASGALLAAAINNERSIYGSERTVILATGDMLQGTAVSNMLEGKPVIEVMNNIHFDGAILGNHEFDWGLKILNQNLANAEFPVILANMSIKPGETDQETNEFSKLCHPPLLINKDGLKIGLIGIISPDTPNVVLPSIMNHFKLQDPAETVNALIPQLNALGADLIIVLAHIGDQYNSYPATGAQPETEPLKRNLAKLVKKISGIAAIMGGNSHTINYDLVPDSNDNPVPAIIGYAYGRGIGVIHLALDENNNIMSAVPGYLDIYHRLYPTLTPEPTTQLIVDSAEQKVSTLIQEVIARSQVTMTRETSTNGNLDSNLGDWSAEVIKDAVQADFGFLNDGALRIDIPAGDITLGQIWTLMPFDNVINTMEMTGSQIKVLLEFLASGIKPMGHIAGLNFSYNPNTPARFTLTADGTLLENSKQNRITWITLPNGTPLEMTKSYTVAAPDFIADGGDYYPFPAYSNNPQSMQLLVRDALIHDLKTRQTLNYLPDGRIQFATISSFEFIKPEFEEIYANKEFTAEFGIRPLVIANAGYLKARINISITSPEGASAEMLGYDPVSKESYNTGTIGYCKPKDGQTFFPNYSSVEEYEFKFSQAGIYTLQYSLVDLINNREIMSDKSIVTVRNSTPTISTDLTAKVSKGQKRNFTIKLASNNNTGRYVRIRISVLNPAQGHDVELKYLPHNEKDSPIKFAKDGVAWLGPEEGFPLYDDVLDFEIKFKKAGNYGIKFEVILIGVLTGLSDSITVLEH